MNENKVALITGASHGIGRALTKNLLTAGWIVFGTGRDSVSLENTKEQFSKFIPIQADFTKNLDIEKVANTIHNSGLSLQLMVHNAGMKSPPRPLTEYNCDSVDEVFFVNLLAPMKLSALLANQMPSESRILFVTSRAANLKLKEGSTYCASKAGLNETAAILRQELDEKNIGVSCVIPGEVDTKIQEILRETQTFHLHQLFEKAHQEGKLISPKICADFLKWVLSDMPFAEFKQSAMPISIYDKWHQHYWLKDENALPAFPF